MRQYLSILIISMFILTACATGEAQKQLAYQSVKPLNIEIEGTKGFTALESPGGTIEEYTGMYDPTKLPDYQVGFRLQLPLSLRNVGSSEWYDPNAMIEFSINDPRGKTETIRLPFKDANVMKRSYVSGEKIDTMEQSTEEDRAIGPGERKVFYFKTGYSPETEGMHNTMVKIESLDRIRGMLVAASALTFDAEAPDSEFVKRTARCSAFKECEGVQVCCSKGVDVPVDERQGHCADECGPGEIEVPYIVKLN